MEVAEKELLVARIVAGCVRCKVKDQEDNSITLAIKKPSLEQIYVAQELYHSYAAELQELECMSEPELYQFMIKEGLWSEKEEKDLEEVGKHIEEFKIKLYEATF